jgi:S1-C subfamily serine protease
MDRNDQASKRCWPKTRAMWLLGLALTVTLLGGCIGAPPSAPSGNAPAPGVPPQSAPAPNTGGQGQIRPTTESSAIVDVYERLSPAVVNISVQAQSRDVLGRPVLQEGTGSGFIVDREGHIVTNEHVVAGADRLDVTLADGTSYVGKVVAGDLATDLAVIKLQAPAEKLNQLTVAPLGNSESVKAGQWVVAIGNPFGLERSVTVGVVSSLGRTRPGLDQRLITDMIQTDAAINPGNSGGPLMNLSGEVVGINEQIESATRGNVGIGFAIPVNTLKRYLPDMVAGKQPQHAWVGVGGATLTPTMAEEFNLSVTQGVIVTRVVPGSPAATAGLRNLPAQNPAAADIVTELDGRPVRRFEDIADVVNDHNPGDTIAMTYLRNGQTQSANVTLGVWNQDFAIR